MKIRNTLAVLLTTLVVVSSLACGSDGGGNIASSNGQNPLESNNLSSTTNFENPLIGTWGNGGYSLTFKSDYTYSCNLSRDGISEGSGSFMISGNVVIFAVAVNNNYIRKDDGQVISGSYTYDICGNTLTFSPVLDLCRDQANILCLSYQKK